ncbi:MAG TPA: hypothetical protein VN724_14545, partial [Pyrinomonadaceae bacterium]|nr:hypothetical protein [Pyrinomonadaceae bacterium]
RENQNSQKTGNEKSFVVIEKLVTRQIRARNFLTISPKVFFRQTLQGSTLLFGSGSQGSRYAPTLGSG